MQVYVDKIISIKTKEYYTEDTKRHMGVLVDYSGKRYMVFFGHEVEVNTEILLDSFFSANSICQMTAVN